MPGADALLQFIAEFADAVGEAHGIIIEADLVGEQHIAAGNRNGMCGAELIEALQHTPAVIHKSNCFLEFLRSKRRYRSMSLFQEMLHNWQ